MLLALGVAGGGFVYVKNLQANNAILQANAIKQDLAIEQEKKVQAQLQKDLELQKSIVKKKDKEIEIIQQNNEFLTKRFEKTNADGKRRDLGDLAANRPKSVERIINNDWANLVRCNMIAQGEPLTEEEIAVVKKTDPGYNTQCPARANPNYKEQ